MMEPPNANTARENLLYIRKTLEAAGQLTAIPGKCLMTVGFLALVASGFNAFVTGVPWSHGSHREAALAAWGITLIVSVMIVSFGIYRKSVQASAPIKPALLRKLLWSLCPALFVGALFTVLAAQYEMLDWLPVIWLGCYGAAVTSGGQHSVAPVRYMGLCFLGTASGAAISPRSTGLAFLALGFGWLHLIYGAYIARRHNG
jgi:hypothetical protein